MSRQIQAHDSYLKLVSEMAALEEDGDSAGAKRLRPKVAAAKRQWHELVRESEAASRRRRAK